MKEAKERYESIEEELTDAHRLMGERGRESETMRRLLAEVEGRSEVRVKDMRERMELAIQERDRAEEDASSVGRRRAREIEDLKSKLRDIERYAKRFADDREDLERAERDLRRQRDDDHRRVEEATQELAELRKAMSEIRDALDESERQVREYEIEIVEQKRAAERTSRVVTSYKRRTRRWQMSFAMHEPPGYGQQTHQHSRPGRPMNPHAAIRSRRHPHHDQGQRLGAEQLASTMSI